MFQNIRLPERCKNRLRDHNEDLQMIEEHLSQTRGPIHSKYVFNVLNTYRLHDLPNSNHFRTDLSNYQVLMHGMDGNTTVDTLIKGFDHLSGKTCVFGSRYYFTTCSTKAANQSCPNAWNFGAKSDSGKIQPQDGYVGYILFCVVGLGNSMLTTDRTKYLNFDRYDSAVYKGAYELSRSELFPSDDGARIQKSPFRKMIGYRYVSDVEKFYFDEICVGSLDQIKPLILAEVEFAYTDKYLL